MSPPWGGPAYLGAEVFDMHTMMVPDGFSIFQAAQLVSENIVYFLPRNVSVEQVAELAGPHSVCELETNCVNGRVKTRTVYFGQLVDDSVN